MVDNLIIATTAREAARLKDSQAKSAFLAGGTEINRLGSTVNARTLISIGRVKELDGIREEDDSVIIGSMCTFQDIIESPLTPAYLKEACLFMGSRTKRNMATIGGNIALRRTDSYLYATLLAAAAKLTLKDKNNKTETRCVCCYLHRYEEFKDLLITEIRVPKNAKVETKRYSNTVQSHAVLTVAVGETTWCEKLNLRIAVAAKNTALTRLDDISEAMEQKELTDEEILKLIKENKELRVTINDLYRKVRGGQR